MSNDMSTKPNTQKLQSLALHYHGLGFNIIPVTISKRALWMDWTSHQTTRQTTEQVKAFPWHYVKDIGAVCGPISGNLAAFDLDEVETFQVVHQLINRLGLPSNYPWVAKTCSGKGYHVLVRCPGLELPENAAGRLKQPGVNCVRVELRWTGHYTILPGSWAYSKTARREGHYEFLGEHFPVVPPAIVTPSVLLSAYASSVVAS
jgi:hypothetical protein